jgi:integrase
MANEGIDPRKANSAKVPTVKEALARFIEERCKPRQRNWDHTEGMLRRACKDWMDRPVTSITRADARQVLRDMQARGRHETAKQSLSWLKTAWKWFASQEIIEHPIMDVVEITVERTDDKDRVYSDDELKAIWKASDKLSLQESSYVKLMILLAPRKTALAMMKWDDLDSQSTLWTTPDYLVKKAKGAKKRVYRTPLPPVAQEMLRKLRRFGKDEHRVFPELRIMYSKAERPAVDTKPLKRRLVLNGAPEDMGFHDFRHTLATFLENAGHDQFDRALALNHAIGGVTSGYSHGFAHERKLAVLNVWAAHVQKLTTS